VGNALEVGQAMFIVSSIIMHEATHWGKYHYKCCEIDGNVRYEMGSVFEKEAFSMRFSNQGNAPGPLDDVLVSTYYNKYRGDYATATFGLSINIKSQNQYWRNIKFGHLPSGQLGDPTLAENGDTEELPAAKSTPKKSTKPYQQKTSTTKNRNYTYD
jgi:hypothetical protein